MNTPSSWLLADSSRYSTRTRLLFMGLSFAIGILTFLLYLAIWYACSRLRRRSSGVGVAADEEAAVGGSVDRGMSAADIAALPTFEYEAPEVHAAAAAEAECAVCLARVEAREKVRRMPKCEHLFHAQCVDAWLRAHSTCPMCRAAVGPPPASSSKKGGADAADSAAEAPRPSV